MESGFEVLTSVIRDFKEQGEAERALTVKQNAALAADMQKAIIVAIQDGEAKAKAVADRSRAHLVAAENSMLDEYETNVYTEFARKAPNGDSIILLLYLNLPLLHACYVTLHVDTVRNNSRYKTINGDVLREND